MDSPVPMKSLVTFWIEDGRDAIGKLDMFCTSLRSLLQRDTVTRAGEVHDAVPVNHCLVADSFAILAIKNGTQLQHRRLGRLVGWHGTLRICWPVLELLSLVVSCKDTVIVSNEEDFLTTNSNAITSAPKRFLPPEPKKSKAS